MRKLDLIKTLTAVSIITAFDFMVVALIFFEIPENNKEIVHTMIGIIEGAFVGSLVGYYWTKSHQETLPSGETSTTTTTSTDTKNTQ